jgi:elongation factor P hydroxylase
MSVPVALVHAPDHREIARRFNATAGRRHGAVLIGGAREPLYVPARGTAPAEIHYTLDYAQSALHELAHWCIAGRARRALPDYGYWYEPPPREPAARAAFFAVESRVQGLELLLARAAGIRFHVSVDDPGSDPGDFAASVQAAACAWLARGFPARTRDVFAALAADWAGRIHVTETPHGTTVAVATGGCVPQEVRGFA